MCGFGRLGEEGFNGGAEAVRQFSFGASDEVLEPVGFEAQPEAFDGVEVRRVTRQELGLEVMPG